VKNGGGSNQLELEGTETNAQTQRTERSRQEPS